MTRVSFITGQDPEDEVYEAEHPNIHLRNARGMRKAIVFKLGAAYPDEVRGLPQPTVTSWDVVITDQGQTMGGAIKKAVGLRVEFMHGQSNFT